MEHESRNDWVTLMVSRTWRQGLLKQFQVIPHSGTWPNRVACPGWWLKEESQTWSAFPIESIPTQACFSMAFQQTGMVLLK